ncbi:MAG: hypothetical protein IPN19_06770 [Elusimicrobia bacterium]|nr:hypothetical protein [Elusimicrobiota bacterium]
MEEDSTGVFQDQQRISKYSSEVFKLKHSASFAEVAQSVEHRSEKPRAWDLNCFNAVILGKFCIFVLFQEWGWTGIIVFSKKIGGKLPSDPSEVQPFEVFMAKDVGKNLLAKTAEWPESWSRSDSDVTMGQAILDAMKPFLTHLVTSGKSKTTLRRHFGHAFLLGGEVIDRVYEGGKLKSLSGEKLLLQFIGEDGGPLCHHNGNEAEHREYDTTCRKLFRYIVSEPVLYRHPNIPDRANLWTSLEK